MKLNLGAGLDKKEGWINTDREMDLNKLPYSYKDNSADEILLCHVLEHLNEPTLVIAECWRILKPNGILTVRVPWYRGIGAFADIDHRHFFYEYSMDKFLPENNIANYETPARFRITRKWYRYNQSKIFRLVPKFMRNFVFNKCLEINWEMLAIKDYRGMPESKALSSMEAIKK